MNRETTSRLRKQFGPEAIFVFFRQDKRSRHEAAAGASPREPLFWQTMSTRLRQTNEFRHKDTAQAVFNEVEDLITIKINIDLSIQRHNGSARWERAGRRRRKLERASRCCQIFGLRFSLQTALVCQCGSSILHVLPWITSAAKSIERAHHQPSTDSDLFAFPIEQLTHAGEPTKWYLLPPVWFLFHGEHHFNKLNFTKGQAMKYSFRLKPMHQVNYLFHSDNDYSVSKMQSAQKFHHISFPSVEKLMSLLHQWNVTKFYRF